MAVFSSRLYGLFVLLLLPCSGLWAGNPSIYRCFATLLFAHYSQGDVDRQPASDHLIRLFKSDPAFAPWIEKRAFSYWDQEGQKNLLDKYLKPHRSEGLKEPKRVDLRSHMKVLEKFSDFPHWRVIQRERDFSVYEERVAFLRTGDTVVFSDDEFVLGPYLGAGNATHIFRLGEDKVIRIPMADAVRAMRWNISDGFSQPEASRHLLGLWKTKRPHRKDVRVVEILRVGLNNEYAIALYFPGTINGRDFMNRALNAPVPEAVPGYEKLMQILEWDRRQGPREMLYTSDSDLARQYQLNEPTLKWGQVDWE